MPNTSKFTTIIFDFDGTLADTFPHLVEINNRLYKKLHSDPIDHAEAIKLKELPLAEWFKLIEVPFWRIPFFVKILVRELDKEVESIKPFAHILVVVHELSKEKLKLGVVTSDATSNVKHFLKLHSLDSYFDFVEHADFIAGKSFTLKRILRKKHLDPSTTLYVGDTTRDIKDAHRAHIKAAAVTWGYNTKTLLAKYNPDYIIDTSEDLLSAIKG